ncbi:MAG TPA: prepilin-type N-terminal cleavage/methylation domain-containing protein [Thermoanaerobaculia bacterium]|nr:prepilin-type N-terminal cleavage/methylation domain-containing protein [Thermoanaerobaculia bacterium]
MDRQTGSSLLELIVVLAILGILVTMSTSATSTIVRRADLRAATGHIRSILELANEQGQVKGTYRAVRFTEVNGVWFYAIYEDGNGNGVSSDEIIRGIDRQIQAPQPLLPTPSGGAAIGFPPAGTVDPDTGRPFTGDPKGIQFGRSSMCSFSEYGDCTPGTIYLTDGVSAGALVRCSGAGGQIRVLYYGLTTSSWSD